MMARRTLRQMFKVSIAPTIVPNGKRDVCSRPHFRLVYSVAHYSQFAPGISTLLNLAQSGSQTWGFYVGVKTE